MLLGNPYLVNAALEAVLETSGIRTGADQLHIKPLIMPPLAEEILGGSNRGDDCQQDAHRGKAARRCTHKKPCHAAKLIS